MPLLKTISFERSQDSFLARNAHHGAKIILLFINLLFFVKYGYRVLGVGVWAVAILYAASAYWGPKLLARLPMRGLLMLFVPWIAILFVAWHKVSLASVQVDRWDAVVYWWNAVQDGIFPYSIRTRFGGFPSPLPVLQLLCLPWVLLGELGLGTLVAWLGFCAVLFRRNPSQRVRAEIVFWTLASPALYWELIARSTILYNALALAFMLPWVLNLERFPKVKGFALGLLLATRVNFVVPVGYLLFRSLCVIRKIPWWAILFAGIGFVLALSPLFFFWSMNAFALNNPIHHQQGHLSIYWSLGIVALALGLAYAPKVRNNSAGAIALIMACFGIGFFQHAVMEGGWNFAFWQSGADISYFLFAYPFALLASIDTPSRPLRA